ncbi:uncharacterized, partial [Tachysurus ichikawai]
CTRSLVALTPDPAPAVRRERTNSHAAILALTKDSTGPQLLWAATADGLVSNETMD